MAEGMDLETVTESDLELAGRVRAAEPHWGYLPVVDPESRGGAKLLVESVAGGDWLHAW